MTFTTPFHAEYWRLACKELKSLKVLVIAALLTALRIAIKMLTIPIGPQLNITFGFLVNAVGSMIYGPVVAVITSAISDTLGAIIHPNGTYFFPFIFEEIAGGVIFALFYYRSKMTVLRVTLGRFAVTVLVNLGISQLIMIWYNQYIFGKHYTFLTVPRVVKNLALFPLQTLLLVLLFDALLPFTNRMGLTYTGKTKLKFTKKDIIILVVMTVVAALAVAGYYWYKSKK